MALFLVSTFTVVTLALAFRLYTRRLPLVFAAHLVSVALLLGLFQAVSMSFNDVRFRLDTLFLLLLLLSVYVGTAIVVGRHARRGAASTERLLQAVAQMPDRLLVGGVAAGIAVKMYLILRYGTAALAVLAQRDVADVSTVEAALDTLGSYIGLGAFWAITLKLTVRRPPLRLIAAWVAYWLLPILGVAELGGARRFAIVTLLLFGLAAWQRARYRLTLRTVTTAVAVSMVILIFSSYFQEIRNNLYGDDVKRLLTSGEPGSVYDGLRLYLTPPRTVDSALYANLSERLSPFIVLYDVTEAQIGAGTTTGGEVLWQSVINSVPRAIYPTKEVVNADEILSRAFGLPLTDLASSVIASVQADMWLFAYAVVPLITGLLLIAYSRLFSWAESRSRLLQLVAIAALLRTATGIEQVPDFMVADARHVAVFGARAIGGLLVGRIVRGNAAITLPLANAKR